MSKEIERLNFMSKIIELDNSFKKRKNYSPINLSSWKNDISFSNYILKNFQYSPSNNPIDYFYYYHLNDITNKKIRKKLSLKKDNDFIITSNNTTSIVCAINFLKHLNLEKICIVSPAYFSINNVLDNFSMKYDCISMLRSNSTFSLPCNLNNYEIVIITNPIFSTSVYFNERDIKYIEFLLNKGVYILVDESLCFYRDSLIKKFGKYKTFITILSPHKAISFNSFKFSITIFDKEYSKFFLQWYDIYSGSISMANKDSISHFLTDNYDLVLSDFISLTNNAFLEVKNILKNFSFCEFDNEIYGEYVTIYIPSLNYALSKQLTFIDDIMNKTDAYFYPGFLHGVREDIGFSFRINLANWDINKKNALLRIMYYIQNSLQ